MVPNGIEFSLISCVLCEPNTLENINVAGKACITSALKIPWNGKGIQRVELMEFSTQRHSGSSVFSPLHPTFWVKLFEP